MSAPTTATPAAVELTTREQQLLLVFRAMDGRRQQEAIVKLTRMAATHPRRVRPALRLVGGGGE